MPEKEKKEQKDIWVVGEVATQTQPILLNTKTEEQLEVTSALAKILNNQEKLMKLLD